MSEKKPEIVREYVVNLRRVYEVSRTKRSKYAINLVRKFIARHLKVNPKYIKIGQQLNRAIWSRGMEKPPRRVRVVAEKYSDGTVSVELR